jgi:mRNA-degrading endonuclease RelE of RelBE toxin-antitoxin system
MTFNLIISKELKRILQKLSKKDKNLAIAVNKKIRQIINLDIVGINHFKNLKGEMSHLKRVHVGSFILTFKLQGGTICFENLCHHDAAY